MNKGLYSIFILFGCAQCSDMHQEANKDLGDPLILNLSILTEEIVSRSEQDDEGLLRHGEIPRKRCVIIQGDKIEDLLGKDEDLKKDRYYLQVRLVNSARISSMHTLPPKGDLTDEIRKTGRGEIWRYTELIARLVPPGIRASMKGTLSFEIMSPDCRNLGMEGARVLPFGKHYLYRQNQEGWVERFLALGKICSYPYAFSNPCQLAPGMTKEECYQMHVLYFFDHEYMLSPISAVPLHSMNTVRLEYDRSEPGYYYWIVDASRPGQNGSSHLVFKGADIVLIRYAINVLSMHHRQHDRAQAGTRVGPDPLKEMKHQFMTNLPSKGESILFIDVLHWYIKHIMMLLEGHLNVRGIFRVVGRLNIIDHIYNKISGPGSIPGDDKILEQISKLGAHDLAGLLKKLVREYPGRLITQAETIWLLEPWTKSMDPENTGPERILKLFHTNQQRLEDRQRKELLVLVAQFLNNASASASSSDTQGEEPSGSGMDIHNLAVVFAPNLFESSSYDVKSSQGSRRHSTNQITPNLPILLKQMVLMTEFLIKNYSLASVAKSK